MGKCKLMFEFEGRAGFKGHVVQIIHPGDVTTNQKIYIPGIVPGMEKTFFNRFSCQIDGIFPLPALAPGFDTRDFFQRELNFGLATRQHLIRRNRLRRKMDTDAFDKRVMQEIHISLISTYPCSRNLYGYTFPMV